MLFRSGTLALCRKHGSVKEAKLRMGFREAYGPPKSCDSLVSCKEFGVRLLASRFVNPCTLRTHQEVLSKVVEVPFPVVEVRPKFSKAQLVRWIDLPSRRLSVHSLASLLELIHPFLLCRLGPAPMRSV